MATKYKAADGSHISNKKAEIYGKRIEELMAKSGYITPPDILDDARKKSSPLHEYFEWDNTVAAEKYRIEQAGHLIRSIVIEVINSGEPQDLRYFYSVSHKKECGGKPTQVYVSVQTISTDSEKRAQVISYALRELKAWELRYSQYSELKTILKFLKKFTSKI